ncbi:hypothetical protein EVAR_79516_1 [Eumeta japonica]|uniref:Uncharacterized protein n=1 Tax=Eumeta variegata TaxID=151549 RepID=A0A4C1UDU2_EUMVA|nr:hypothetical protein EVAR_79516_1 [Eumeta japonica]
MSLHGDPAPAQWRTGAFRLLCQSCPALGTRLNVVFYHNEAKMGFFSIMHELLFSARRPLGKKGSLVTSRNWKSQREAVFTNPLRVDDLNTDSRFDDISAAPAKRGRAKAFYKA